MKKEKNKLNKRILIILIILAFLIFNLYLFNRGFHSWDVTSQQDWGNYAVSYGLPYLYTAGFTDYPPLYLYVLKFNSWITLNFFGNNISGAYTYVFISKIIPMLGILLTGLILFFYLKKKDYKLAILGMILYLFNLALIYDASYWGQVDSINTLFVFLSIIFLINKKYIFSTFFITLAILTKFQSIVLIPVIGIVILLDSKVRTWIKCFLTALLTLIVIFLPYIISGAFIEAFNISFNPMDQFPFVTVNAFNLWYLISPVAPDWRLSLRDTTVFFGFSLKSIGLFFLAVYTLFVVYQLIKKKDTRNILLGAASMAFAFFMLPTQIHERHLFPFFALLLLFVMIERKFLWVYITMSITYLLNLMIVFNINNGVFIFYPIQLIINFIISALSTKVFTTIIALVNIFVFMEFSRRGIFKSLYLNLKEDWFNFKKWLKK